MISDILVVLPLLWRLAQFTPSTDRTNPLTLFEGNWQSCEVAGEYSERIYDHPLPPTFEFHLGPNHEFALFQTISDDHQDHMSEGNLLKPFDVPVVNGFGKHVWKVIGLKVEVTLAGGSYTDCESWWVKISKVKP